MDYSICQQKNKKYFKIFPNPFFYAQKTRKKVKWLNKKPKKLTKTVQS